MPSSSSHRGQVAPLCRDLIELCAAAPKNKKIAEDKAEAFFREYLHRAQPWSHEPEGLIAGYYLKVKELLEGRAHAAQQRAELAAEGSKHKVKKPYATEADVQSLRNLVRALQQPETVLSEETEYQSAEQWKAAFMAMRGENKLLQRRIVELELSGVVCCCGRSLGHTFGDSERKRRRADVEEAAQHSHSRKLGHGEEPSLQDHLERPRPTSTSSSASPSHTTYATSHSPSQLADAALLFANERLELAAPCPPAAATLSRAALESA